MIFYLGKYEREGEARGENRNKGREWEKEEKEGREEKRKGRNMREKCHDMSRVFLADPKGWYCRRWSISLAENVFVSNVTLKMSFQFI